MTTMAAEIRALAAAQKTSAGVSLYSRYINRPFGRVFAVLAVRAKVSPNAVSLISAAVTAAGLAVLIAAPITAGTGLVCSALLVIGFALDSADGQVARITRRSSPAGEWLDHVIDSGKMVAVHGSVLVAVFIRGDIDPRWLVVPLVFTLVSTVMFAGGLLTGFLAPRVGPARNPSTVRAIALVPADYGVLALAFCLWGIPAVFITVYTILFSANVLLLVLLLAKWFREVSRAG